MIKENIYWKVWLQDFDKEVIDLGYRKYNQNHKSEDFSYWKTFYDGEEKIYQVGILVYDFGMYSEEYPNANRVSVQYECYLLCDNRIDLSVSKDISLSEFEDMAKTFYETMIRYV